MLWHQGALVKHCREFYKAEGISNAAEPGNQAHARFYVSTYRREVGVAVAYLGNCFMGVGEGVF
jgi:hypothetical protein